MPSNIPGYLAPSSSQGLPGGLTLTQFIQSVIVGVSGYTGTLVRPKWQVAPPKQPDIGTDWIAFGLQIVGKDKYAYTGIQPDETYEFQRHERLEIQVAFYGPNAQENISLFQDGFQIQQNLEAMLLANIGYTDVSQILRGPDLVNERWIDRYEMTLYLTRQVQRTYPILSFASVVGTIHTVVDGDTEPTEVPISVTED